MRDTTTYNGAESFASTVAIMRETFSEYAIAFVPDSSKDKAVFLFETLDVHDHEVYNAERNEYDLVPNTLRIGFILNRIGVESFFNYILLDVVNGQSHMEAEPFLVDQGSLDSLANVAVAMSEHLACRCDRCLETKQCDLVLRNSEY